MKSISAKFLGLLMSCSQIPDQTKALWVMSNRLVWHRKQLEDMELVEEASYKPDDGDLSHKN